MQYGICLLSLIPCRKEADNCSEMVTQLLFGETYTVTEQNDEWVKILNDYDQYECWINRKQYTRISEANFKLLQKNESHFCCDLLSTVQDLHTKIEFPISIGSRIPLLSKEKSVFESHHFLFEGKSISGNEKKTAKNIIQTAKQFINAPYLWGGKSPFGIDCSGFTQLVFQLNGYKLPRDASQQVELGAPLNFVEESEAGDLAFFDNEEGKIIHVGILLDHEHIIHASGKVRIDRFDHYGIHNSDTKKYTHTLRVIKKLVNS
ncbi:MAG: C40 family peptidase [Sphingobacteriaceae bacterium]|nr:C40 family peptidase [Sphingobacteriaceae bacterium]